MNIMISYLKGRVKAFASKKGYDVCRLPAVLKAHPKEADLSFSVAERLIESRIQLSQNPVVIQIGAFDGKSNDFLFEYIRDPKVRSVLVEPQPDVFVNLKNNYKGFSNVTLCNAAIATDDTDIPFYSIKKEYHSSFRLAPQLASMDRTHLVRALSIPHLKGLPENREDAIECVSVKGKRLDTLLSENKIEHVDVLQIDTEGFDYEIIKMLDFEFVKPEIINFEIVHLSHAELDECMWLLYEKGYQMLRYGINMVAMRLIETGVDKNFFVQ
ncbi:MAG: FkbM family methyltransferase [Opitutales bacterium]|nr:FkbM family methyltransferase [Opitutales bacterium]